MIKRKHYLGRALGGVSSALHSGVEKADEALDTAVESGGSAVKKAGQIGDTAVHGAAKAAERGGKGARKYVKGTKEALTGPNKVETLERLGRMWQDGLLTDEEFQQAKAKLLDEL